MKNKFDLVWNNFHKELEGFIYTRVKEREITKDVLQEVFIKIYTNIETLKDDTKLSSWIYQITRTTINDYFRKLKHPIEMLDFKEMEEHETTKNTELEQCLYPFINQLEDKYREAIILVELNGLSQKQLAEKLNISYSGAKSRVQRAKKYLKKLFTNCCTIQSDKFGNVVYFNPNNKSKNCCD
jgi:RNA polymerase sigma-70 factor (ECF subfamily)